MNDLWTATAWLLSIATLYCAGWALIAAQQAKLEMVRVLERITLVRTTADDSGATAMRATYQAAAAHERAAEAFSVAQAAKIEMEAMKRSTHTIQLVPVDDVADKALNKGLDQVDEVSFEGLDDIHDRAGPLG